jgi:RNA polymerase sigma factor (sigma-70 family)
MQKSANDQVGDASCSPPRCDHLLLVARAAGSGDAEAIRTLLVEVGGAMLRTIRKVLGRDHPDVEDVAQDAFLALLAGLLTFRAECSVGHFANRVALLTALTARRRLRTRQRFSAPEGAVDAPADDRTTSPLVHAIANRRRSVVLDLLERLASPTAEALAMHFVLGYTVDEIAAAAGVPPNTVWSRLRLGKQALRRALAQDSAMSEFLEARGP